jgi:transposase
MKTRKKTEWRLAHDYVVDKGYTFDMAAKAVGVDPKTISKWANDDNWEDQAAAKETEDRELLKDLKAELREILDKKKSGELKASVAYDGISKIQKSIDALQKQRVTLGQYLFVMEDVFLNIRKDMPELFVQLIDFQVMHAGKVSQQYK